MSDQVPCREQIVAAVLTRLADITGVTAERNRRNAIGQDDLATPRLILFAGSDTDVTQYTGEDTYELTLRIQGAVLGGGVTAETALNTLRAKVIVALRPPADFTLGGLARFLTIEDTGEEEIAGVEVTEFEGFVLQASVIYATAEGDPFTFADA